MKKIITLLFIIASFFTKPGFAQPGTICNAAFSFSTNATNNAVQFVPASVDASALLQHQWWFGDGSYSNLPAPSYQYQSGGIYLVQHIVTYRSPNDSTVVICTDSASAAITITGLPACSINARFSFFRDGTQPNKIHFNNLSTGTNPNTVVRWSFGDGTSTFDPNPTHVYQDTGYFNVCLSVKNDSSCTSDSCAVVFIPAHFNDCNLVVNFSTHVDSLNPLLVHFSNLTNITATDSVSWMFGDGSSTWQNSPSHQYSQPGTYHVCLLVKRQAAGAVPCIREHCQTITLMPQQTGCNLHSNFSFVRDSVQPNKIYFTNLSDNANPGTMVRWKFGDGSFSTDQNPTHVFPASGLYNVCLGVRTDSTCAADTCKPVQIQLNNPCELQVNFSAQTDSANSLLVHFFNQTGPLTSADSVSWHFGDGSTSSQINPSHTYNQPGIYNVCLVVRKNTPGTFPCVREFCRPVAVQQQNNCDLVADFYFYHDSLPATPLNNYIFENTSAPLSAIDSSFWDFGDGTPVAVNPNTPVIHHYTLPGVYTVCLKIKKVLAGSTNIVCERQICKTLVVPGAPPVCNLQVDFNWRQDSSQFRRILFTNLSTPEDSNVTSTWTFGDGTVGYQWNAEHTYFQTGQFLVCLKVMKNNTCVRDTCQLIVVSDSSNPTPCNLQPYFVSTTDSADISTVHFTNLSTPFSSADSIAWNFGDGSGSVEANPSHRYEQPGYYEVCVTVNKNNPAGTTPCIRSYCSTIRIETPCDIVPSFSYYKDSSNGGAGLVYHFSNTTVPFNSTDSVTWNFGDDSPLLSGNQHPVHVYQAPGTYPVCITVKKQVPGTVLFCERQSCQLITVTGDSIACNLPVDFSWQADSSDGHKILFHNLTGAQPGAAYTTWTFGDGFSSSEWSPDYRYPQSGEYTVCLRVTLNNSCSKDTCKVITVLPTIQDSCQVRVSFTAHTDSVHLQKVYFNNTTPLLSSQAVFQWNFGDGTAGTGPNPHHLYARPGWYAVCLTIRYPNNNCVRSNCDSIFVQANEPAVNCDSIHLNFVHRRDGYMPNKIFFFAMSNRPVLQQHWTFTNLANNISLTSDQFNPVHVFADTGRYRVCLRARYGGDCVKEYCDVVRVHNTNTPSECRLQAYPNPAHHFTSVNVELQQAGIISIAVFNMQNVLLQQQTVQGATGNNLIRINTERLCPGFYTVRILNGGRVCHARFHKF